MNNFFLELTSGLFVGMGPKETRMSRVKKYAERLIREDPDMKGEVLDRIEHEGTNEQDGTLYYNVFTKGGGKP